MSSRLLLDAHLSHRHLGEPLRRRGHDVLCLDERRDLDGLADTAVMELACRSRRIFVTANHADFAPLLRDLAEAGGHHAGCVLLAGVRHDAYGVILRGLERALATYTDWDDLTVVMPTR